MRIAVRCALMLASTPVLVYDQIGPGIDAE